MWQNKSRPNKTAKVPYAYAVSEDDPLVLIPDPEMVRWVEDALDHLDQGNSTRRVAAWLVEKTGKNQIKHNYKLDDLGVGFKVTKGYFIWDG